MYVVWNEVIFMPNNFLNSKILTNFASAIALLKRASVAKT